MIEPCLRPSSPVQSPVSKSLILASKTNSNPRRAYNSTAGISTSSPARHYSAPVTISASAKTEPSRTDATPLLSKTDRKKFVAASAIGTEAGNRGSAKIYQTQPCCCIIS